MYKLVIPLLWASWCVLWLILARGAKKTRWREGTMSKLSYAVPGAIAFWSLFLSAPPDQFWFRPFLPWSPIFYWAGVALILAGFAITVWARLILGANWSATVTVKENHELITAGPYRLVRHPIYSGLLLAALGSALPREDPRAVAAVLLILLAILRKAGIEEGRMIATFGDQYRTYRSRTKAVIPYIL
jgi:protein-S-isoprenylcysteine O-methyltransferase Ste14